MQDSDPARKLLAELGGQLGIEGLTPDEDGQCLFSIDGTPVSIETRDGRWRLRGLVAEVAEEEENPELTLDAWQWRALLEMNLELVEAETPGSLAYDRAAECVLYIQPVPESGLEAGRIAAQLEAFVHHLEAVRRLLDGFDGEFDGAASGGGTEDGLAVVGRLI